MDVVRKMHKDFGVEGKLCVAIFTASFLPGFVEVSRTKKNEKFVELNSRSKE
jgi:hypothetical protein